MNKDFGVMDVGVSHYMTVILFSFAAFVPIKLADVSKPTSKTNVSRNIQSLTHE